MGILAGSQKLASSQLRDSDGFTPLPGAIAGMTFPKPGISNKGKTLRI
jgi:hypothetical protein